MSDIHLYIDLVVYSIALVSSYSTWLLYMRNKYLRKEQLKDSDFSKFMRLATPEEKEKMYMHVLDQVAEEQWKILEASKYLD